MKKVKKGFTLVELSIVLVIIGLLIGGILVGQSLIDSAKINQAVRQIQQYDIAVSNFYERFRQLPGDSDLMTPAGNNDGDIHIGDDVAGGVPVCGVASCYEFMSFWKHLSDSNMLKDNYTNDFSNGAFTEDNSPLFLDKVQLTTFYGMSDGGAFNSKGWQYDTTQSGYTIEGAVFIALEKKLDDGVGSTGFVRGLDVNTFDACTIDTGDACQFLVKMMSTTGNPLNN